MPIDPRMVAWDKPSTNRPDIDPRMVNWQPVREAPADSAVLFNGINKGIAGVPDSLLNLPTQIGNLGIAAYGTIATALGRPDLAPELMKNPDLAHRAMKALGLVRDSAEPQTGGQRILDSIGQAAGGAVLTPTRSVGQAAANLALGAGSGAVGGTVGELTGNPMLGAVASMGALPAVAGVANTAVRGARLAKGGQDTRTGRILATAADMDPAALAAQIRAGNITLVPGSAPTTTQAAMNPGLSQLQRSAQAAGANFSTREAQQNAARLAQLDGIAPGASAYSSIDAAENAGNVIRGQAGELRQALKEAIGGVYNSPELASASLNLPPQAGVQSILDQFYPKGALPGDGNAGTLFAYQKALNPEGVVSLKEFDALRKQAGNKAAELRDSDRTAAAAWSAVKDQFDAAEAAAVAKSGEKFAVTGQGPFGPVYGNLAGDAQNSVAHLLRMGEGSIPAAGTHPFFGPIELAAGQPLTKGGSGILHVDAHGRDEALRRIPDLMSDGVLYGRVEGRKFKPKGGDTGQLFLSDGDYEGVLTDYVRTPQGKVDRGWMPTVYPMHSQMKIPLETGQSVRASGSTPATQASQGTSNSSIDDMLGQMLAESASQRAPAAQPPRDPRQYVGGLLAPDQAEMLDQGRFLHRTLMDRYETGPAKGIWRTGSDGMPVRNGAEIAKGFYNGNASQAADIDQFWKMLPGNEEATGALRNYAMADLLEKSVNKNSGLLSNDKLTGYTNTRSGALKGLLSADDMDALEAVQADLRRSTEAENLNRVKGSDTAQKLLGAGLLESPLLSKGAALVPKIGPAAVDWLKNVIRQQQAKHVGASLLDPATAERALGAYQSLLSPTLFDAPGNVAPFMGMGLLGNLQ